MREETYKLDRQTKKRENQFKKVMLKSFTLWILGLSSILFAYFCIGIWVFT